MSNNKIYDLLCELGLASEATRCVFAEETRDVKPLKVYRDRQSGVIYIDQYYCGETTFEKGDYRDKKTETNYPLSGTFENRKDVQRRSESLSHLFVGKTVADFGCGAGDFLREIHPVTQSSVGVELQESYVDALNRDNIKCVCNLSEVAAQSLDTLFAFHVLNEIPNPVEILGALKSRLKRNGTIVIELPHARDFLLSHLKNEAFKRFTLCSLHLVWHTRDSLRRLLEHAGFVDIVVQGIQRYPLSNHFHWASDGLPGGHKGQLAVLDSSELTAAYESALLKIDATDTLIATAKNPSLD